MDVSNFKLTLPISSDYKASGPAHEITTPQDLVDGNSFFFFENKSDHMVLRCPDKGATTPSTTYARSELRHLTDYAVNEPSSLSAKIAVDAAKTTKNLHIMQIHGGGSPWVKITYKNGLVRAMVKPYDDSADDTKIVIAENIPLGQVMDLSLDYDGNGELSITLDGYTVKVQMSRSGTYYYKMGAYPSDDTDEGFLYIVRHVL